MDISLGAAQLRNGATNAKRLLRVFVAEEGEERDDDLIWIETLSSEERSRAMFDLEKIGAVVSVDHRWQVTPLGYEISAKLEEAFAKLHYPSAARATRMGRQW